MVRFTFSIVPKTTPLPASEAAFLCAEGALRGWNMRGIDAKTYYEKGIALSFAERGVSGGYNLARTPGEITVGDVVRVLEDDIEIVDCIGSSCPRCASGSVWQRLYDGINQVLDSITLQSLLDDFAEGGLCKCRRGKEEV